MGKEFMDLYETWQAWSNSPSPQRKITNDEKPAGAGLCQAQTCLSQLVQLELATKQLAVAIAERQA